MRPFSEWYLNYNVSTLFLPFLFRCDTLCPPQAAADNISVVLPRIPGRRHKNTLPPGHGAEYLSAITVYSNLRPSHLSEVRKRQTDHVQYPDLTHPPFPMAVPNPAPSQGNGMPQWQNAVSLVTRLLSTVPDSHWRAI